MLLFSCPNLFLFILGVCQRWKTGVMEEKGLEIESKFSTKQATVFNFVVGNPSHPNYPLSGDNRFQESRTSLTLKSGWRRQIFPIPR